MVGEVGELVVVVVVVLMVEVLALDVVSGWYPISKTWVPCKLHALKRRVYMPFDPSKRS